MTLSAEHIPLHKHTMREGVTWERYERLLERIGNRPIRVTYDDERMEIGSTTYRRRDLKAGLEPDKCYYIKNEAKVRGMERFDAKVHPPPDLAIDVEVTRRSVPREPIYARLGVPEIWRSKNVRITVRLLGEDGKYHDAPRSAAFAFLPLREFEGFVRRLLVEDPNAVVREFRQWVGRLRKE
jgi:Uma2 family endonuclease